MMSSLAGIVETSIADSNGRLIVPEVDDLGGLLGAIGAVDLSARSAVMASSKEGESLIALVARWAFVIRLPWRSK